MEGSQSREAAFRRERPHLLAVAFRILGSDADAQDIVQEAWIRYARADVSEVRNLPAWLTTVVSRLCLDVLRRAHEYPQEPAEMPVTPTDSETGPEEIALLASELTEAWRIVLEALTPPQRVALVLHDVFGLPFEAVAHVLGTTAESAKKLASRARGRLRHRGDTPETDPAEARRVVRAFLAASQQGDIDGLVKLLDPGVTRTADPQVLPRGAPQRLQGVQAVVTEARKMRPLAQRGHPVEIDGQPGIAVHSADGLRAALVFQFAGGRIVHYDVISDPRRLALLHIED